MTLEKRKEKEQKELTRLRKINQKPETAKYIKWIFGGCVEYLYMLLMRL